MPIHQKIQTQINSFFLQFSYVRSILESFMLVALKLNYKLAYLFYPEHLKTLHKKGKDQLDILSYKM